MSCSRASNIEIVQPRIQCWDRPGRFAAWRVHEVHAPIAVLVLTYILGLMYLIQREFIVGVIQCVIGTHDGILQKRLHGMQPLKGLTKPP